MPDPYDFKSTVLGRPIGSQQSLGVKLVPILRPFSVEIRRLNGILHPDPCSCLRADQEATGFIRVARLHTGFDMLKEFFRYINNRHSILC